MSAIQPIRHHGPEYHNLVGWYVGWWKTGVVHSMAVYVMRDPNANRERAAAISRAYEIMELLHEDLDPWTLMAQPGSQYTYKGHDDIQTFHRSEGFV